MKTKITDIILSLFGNPCSTPSTRISINEFYRLVRFDNDVRDKTDSYRNIMATLGKHKADLEVKQKRMPAVAAAVCFDGRGRRTENITSYTGLAMVDLDNVKDTDRAFARITADEHTLLAYRTISGKGLRVLYRYERDNNGNAADDAGVIDQSAWRAAFTKGNEYYAAISGTPYDKQCSDITRLCGLAHDDEAYFNPNAVPLTVTDEEVFLANFSSSHERGRKRTIFDTGTNNASPEEAWRKISKQLSSRGITYQNGSHHNFVMHAAFLFNRYGVDIDEVLEWAARNWADYNERERVATIRSCYRKTEEHGTLACKRKRQPTHNSATATLMEIHEWLDNHMTVIYNNVTDMMMYKRKDKASAKYNNIDDRVVCSIRSQMAKDMDKRVQKQDIMDVLRSDFSAEIHPVRDYIRNLPEWDGKDYVTELAGHLTVKAVQPGQGYKEAHDLMMWALHKWLVGTVATWIYDDAINHQIFVLIGQQGIMKTTFFRSLLPQELRYYFLENSHNSFRTKDDHLALTENCLVEIEEIDMQRMSDVSELKALVTANKIKVRRPYQRLPEERSRMASFCGSGNQEHFLIDDTGNRRWLCFLATHIDDPRTWNLNYEQLYAQLYTELRGGFQYWFNSDDEQRMQVQNSFFRVESDEEQLIRYRLRPPKVGEKITLMNASAISQYINGGAVGRGLSSRKIAMLMPKMGFKMVHKRDGNFYSVFVIPPDQLDDASDITEESKKSGEQNLDFKDDLPF